MSELKIIVPAGAFGKNEFDTQLDSFLREFSERKSQIEGEWAEKYGIDHESENVVMKRFCWCEQDECPYCYSFEDMGEPSAELQAQTGMDKKNPAPNFWFKPLDFKVWWYKYIGRSVTTNKELSVAEFRQMYDYCMSL